MVFVPLGNIEVYSKKEEERGCAVDCLLQEYGYPILILGALLEGESVLLLGGGMAYFGYLSLPMVILVSFVGAIIHDQLLYFAGKRGLTFFLKRSETMERKSQKVFRLLKKYDYWLIMGFRFVYGLRTLTPMVVGASGLSLKRYTVLTVTSAAFWAVSVSCVGYLCATAIEKLISRFQNYQIYLGIGLLVIVLGVAIFFLGRHQVRKRRIKKKAHPREIGS